MTVVESGAFKIHCDEPRFIGEVLEKGEYSFADNGRVNNVVMDVGSNIGTYAMYIYDKAKVIYAIEPSPEYELLEKNIQENKLDKIKPFKIALSNNGDIATMHKNAGTGSWCLGDSNNLPTARVVTKTLYAFMDEHGITHVDLLKIDIEGAEIEVFSSDDFTKVEGAIDTIFGEYHGNSGRLKELLESHNFAVEVLPNGPHFIARRIVNGR